MEALQIKYIRLKEVAKSFMTNGKLNDYFNVMTEVNAIHIKILELRLSSK